MKQLTKAQQVQRSIMKRFREEIWTKFILALKRYNLVEDGDRIAVCVSGGKDSFLLAVLMQQLQKFSDTKFELVFLCMDPGYSPKIRQKIEENARHLEIPLQIFETDIFESVEDVEKSPCYLCARMRRGHLYSAAKARGCNKIALAHHFSDVIETTLMGMLYGAQIQAMPPKLQSKNFEGMTLIRPLYCVHLDDILAWKNYNGLEFINCACRFTEKLAQGEYDAKEEHLSITEKKNITTEEEGKRANEKMAQSGTEKDVESARMQTRALIKQLKEKIPDVEDHIFKSIHNVQLDTVLGVKYLGGNYDFNTLYAQKTKKSGNNVSKKSSNKKAKNSKKD